MSLSTTDGKVKDKIHEVYDDNFNPVQYDCCRGNSLRDLRLVLDDVEYVHVKFAVAFSPLPLLLVNLSNALLE